MFFIPYKCRCEAIGGNRRRGERYKCLNGKWSVKEGSSGEFEREFDLPVVWKGLLVYLREENGGEYSVCINGQSINLKGEVDVTENLKPGKNTISVLLGEDIDCPETVLKRFCLTARPAKHVEKIDIHCDLAGDLWSINVIAGLGGRLELGNMPKLTAELYDEDLELVTSAESVFEKSDGVCKAGVRLNTEAKNEPDSEYTLLLLCAGEVLRQKISINKEAENGCSFEEPPHEDVFTEDAESICKITGVPLKITLIEGKNGVLGVKNTSGNVIPAGTEVPYKIYNQRGVYREGAFFLPEILPDGIKAVNLGYKVPEISPFEYFLNVGEGVYLTQYKLPVTQTVPERSYSDDMPEIEIINKDGMLTVKGENFLHEFDLEKGSFSNISIDGVSVVKDCNGFGADVNMCCRVLASEKKYVVISGTGEKDGRILSAMWIIYGNGEISVSLGSMEGDVKAGLTLLPEEEFSEVCYFGDNYLRKGVAGIFKKELTGLDKTSMEDVRWLLVNDKQGRGLLIKSTENFSVPDIASGKISLSGGQGAFSFAVRPLFTEDEDVVREARTLPCVG
ncbi:MAG: hypothetical protein J6A50_03575 [Clostridia bacterium]|nr:hypothetical protein [Clostridia bacterium]